MREAGGNYGGCCGRQGDRKEQQAGGREGLGEQTLLTYKVARQEGLLSISSEDGCFMVASVRQMNLDGFLTVDQLTQAGLQIFSEEQHPSAMGIGKAKEGLSVFGLMDSCVTPMVWTRPRK